MGKHTDKILFDAPLGIRTVPVLVGPGRSLALTRGLIVGYYALLVAAVAARCLPWPALLGLVTIWTARTVWGPLSGPAPATRPRGFPVWPLWYAAWTFVHTRRAGTALVAGVALAAIFDVTAF
jgi:1,4-dihydroxy-2-naphthoate octaprenyltransferase